MLPNTTITTDGGLGVAGSVTAGTVIGRDQIFVLTGYTTAQLEDLLPQLRTLLSDPRADLRTDLTQSQPQLTVTVPDAPTVTLSEQAARDLLPVAAQQGDERAYLTALRVNPRYGRWARMSIHIHAGCALRQPPLWPLGTAIRRPGRPADHPRPAARLERHPAGIHRFGNGRRRSAKANPPGAAG